MRAITLGLAFTAVVTGCAVTPYQPPKQDEPSAVVTFANRSSRDVTFWPNSDAERCTGSLLVQDLFNLKPGRRQDLLVRAGQEFSVSAQQFSEYGLQKRMCVIDGTFRPEVGSRYVIQFHGNNSGCTIFVDQDIGAGVTSGESSFRLRKRVVPLVGEAYCE